MSERVGTITWISGPVVRARGSRNIGMLELVEVGDERLVGEVIGLDGDIITAQVYEETSGMQTGAPILWNRFAALGRTWTGLDPKYF